MTKISKKKIEKIVNFIKKSKKFVILKNSKLFYRNKNCSVTYYQSLYEVSWAGRTQIMTNFEKFEKKIQVLSNNC